ncbi:MAG: tRNA-queuosine alpha-mannosyltransferase domain-containing protein, partial [Litorivicinus sp.]
MNPNNARVLVVSAYDADTHQYWYHRLTEMYPNASFTRIALPPVNYAWRQRGNALRLARDFATELSAPYDMLWVTSAVDLATLRGLVPCLASL